MQTTILIVEDDEDIRKFLVETLRDLNYVTYQTDKGTHALEILEKIKPDLVILDLGLPDIDGESVCSKIKKMTPDLPVIILTASTDSSDLVNSFSKGADDYVKKPFNNEELIARIKAQLRKTKQHDPVIKVGDLSLNTKTLEVKRGTAQIELTQTEFSLLHYLMINANNVLSREQILSHVWAQDPDVETRVVDVYIGYLRKKIELDKKTKLIQSRRGFGYVIKG